MAKELIEYTVFDAGLNTKADPINLLPGQSDNINNILFGDYGSIKTRDGISTHNSTPMGSGDYPVVGLTSYRPPEMSAMLVAVCDGTMYIMTGAATAPVSVPSSNGLLASTENVELVQMNQVLFVNSPNSTQQYKFNGSEFTRAGVSAPTQTLTAVCDAAAGNLTGTYRYVYWGVNSYSAEGDYIVEASTAVAVTSAKVRVNNIPTAPISYGINTWKIGRNTANAAGIYWYVTDVTNGTTAFTDNLADSSLVTLAPTDQGYPRRFYCTCVYAGRFWGAVDDYLWYSEVDKPETFPSTNFIRVGGGSGLNICSITPFMGMIVIGLSEMRVILGGISGYAQKTALYVLRIGDSISFRDPESWYLNLIAENEGSESHRACIPMAGYLWMTGRKGVSLFNGESVASSSVDTATGASLTTKISDPIETLFTLTEPSNIRMACAIEWKNKIYLSIDRSDGGTNFANDTTLIYDYMRTGQADPKKGAWSKFDGISASQFTVHEDRLYGGGAHSGSATTTTGGGGYIYRWDNGNNTDGYGSISPTYRMSVIRGHKNHVYHDKDFRIVNVWASGIGILTLTFKINGNNYDGATTVHTASITLSTAGSKTQIKLPGVVSGKHLWIQLSMTVDFPTTNVIDLNLTRIQVFYNVRGLRNA